MRLNITLVRIISYINETKIDLAYVKRKMVVRCVCCHFILFSRLPMEQTEATEVTDAINTLTLDADRMTGLRRSQINLLNATIDESNFYINEVRLVLLNRKYE